MTSLSEFYKGKRVLVTGHTGFKGSWLSIWLNEMGAVVGGISQDPSSDKDNYSLSDISGHLDLDARADIRNGHWLKEIITEWKPDIVFHLAAQPLVRLSYSFPVDTFETNVLGTINVMEAIRLTPSVRSAVMITTDKCYENKEQIWGYRENDPMGGHDPYSASKGAAELAISSWRRSFFNTETLPDGQHQQIASARAGNVIGGGDWAKDRIVPDCIRALEEGRPVEIRSPHAVRPWQHVLEPLSGYLLLAKLMWEHPNQYNGTHGCHRTAETDARQTKVQHQAKDHCHRYSENDRRQHIIHHGKSGMPCACKQAVDTEDKRHQQIIKAEGTDILHAVFQHFRFISKKA